MQTTVTKQSTQQQPSKAYSSNQVKQTTVTKQSIQQQPSKANNSKQSKRQ
jgi:hypothetical protein